MCGSVRVEGFGVKGDMVFHEGGDEEIAMVIAFLHPVGDFLAARGSGRGQRSGRKRSRN